MIAYLVLTVIFVLSIGLAIYLSIISKRAEKSEKEILDDNIEELDSFELENKRYKNDILEDSNEFKTQRIEEKDHTVEEII